MTGHTRHVAKHGDVAKRALILGTLAGQMDAIRMLREGGWTVFACGHRRDGPGVEGADAFYLTDIVDVQAVADLAQRLDAGVVYSVGSDLAMPTVVRVSEQLGLPCFHGTRITDTLQRKDLLRAFLDEQGLSPVRSRVLRAPGDEAGFDAFPAVVKPVDSQGQRGIEPVGSAAEVAAALPRCLAVSRSGVAILEEWLDGPEISVHTFVLGGEVRFFLPSDRHVWRGPLVGVPRAHAVPSRSLDGQARAGVEALVRQVVAGLGVREGPLYFQLKLTPAGPRVVEVASRLDGCHLWRLIEVHTGFNLMAACFDRLAGHAWTDPQPWDDSVRHVLTFYLGPPSEPFRAGEQRQAGPGRLVYQEFQVREGARPRATNGAVARLGYEITEEA